MQEAEQGSGERMDAGAVLVKQVIRRGESARMVDGDDEARRRNWTRRRGQRPRKQWYGRRGDKAFRGAR